ncbi:hypothetical protein KGF57_004420 [Candida theae]|uniref:C3H1-type domain-containing protein n=1 Tax=Candida theae TaxID=1198502 RepID=A0AAD5BB63_9ASCO|nr:uncharacterized protein KGF57_004420 [Candida theae]KAI5950075.1 hypothetical protein KGF57_004420 [Candida theae]
MDFLLDLPTHLPNETPDTSTAQAIAEQPPAIPSDNATSSTKDTLPHSPTTTSKKVVSIPGTNITLQTEEDIAKWIEARKKNWPTRANVERKQQLKEEKRKSYQQPQRQKRSLEEDEEGEGDANGGGPSENKRSKTICRFFQQYGKCKYGNRCKNIHEAPNPRDDPNPIATKFNNTLTHSKRQLNGVTILVPKLYSNRTQNTATSQSSLFKHLITQDQMKNENSLVIDFIRYLDDKGKINHDVMKDRK